jgi:hypothetical protein
MEAKTGSVCCCHWKSLTDQQIVAVIHQRGKKLCAKDVTLGYIRAMRHYRMLYPEHCSKVLSFLVRLDIEDGVDTCFCRCND